VAERIGDIGFVGVNRDNHHAGARRLLPDASRHLQAVHAGHRQVHHQHIRGEFSRQAHGLQTITGVCHKVKRRLLIQEALQPLPHYGVVFGQEDSSHLHRSAELSLTSVNGLGWFELGWLFGWFA
jgi:hypothetical protein